MKMRITEEIWKEGSMYVSYCPEMDIASCGEDIKQAKENLLETILINIEDTKKMGTYKQFIEECGLEETDTDVLSVRKELIGFTPIEVAV